jgi:hypothetical protein
VCMFVGVSRELTYPSTPIYKPRKEISRYPRNGYSVTPPKSTGGSTSAYHQTPQWVLTTMSERANEHTLSSGELDSTDLPWVVNPPRGFMGLAISLGPFPLPVLPSLTPFGSKTKRGQGVLRPPVCVTLKPLVLMC